MGNSALQGFGYIGESRGFVFDSTTMTWVAMTASAAGAASTQVSVREIQTSSGASVMDSTEGAVKVNVVAGSVAGDTTATVTPASGSTFFTMPKSTEWASSAGFHFEASSGALLVGQGSTVFAVQLSQYSTTAQVSSVAGIVKVGPHDTNYASSAGFHFDSTGQVLAAPLRASTSARASLTQSSTSVTAQSANGARLQWTAINMPTQNARVFLKFGATASTTDFDVYIMPGERYEMPRPIYTGRIDAIWESTGTGFLRTTEWLA